MTYLTGPQLQTLIDKYGLVLDLENGVAVASRPDGYPLKASTIARMVGLKETPANWREVDRQVRGL